MAGGPRRVLRALTSQQIPRRLRIAGLHFVASAVVAAMAAAAIFLLWYPSPFAAISGGAELFILLVAVDVVVGPALTLVVADSRKPRAELFRDMAVIAVVQFFALSYGMYAVSEARPVLLSFEVDRFRVVSAAEIDPATLDDAPPELRSLSWTGPRLVAAVKPIRVEDQARAVLLGMSGVDLSMDPRNWRPYAEQAAAAWRAAQPLPKLIDRYPSINSQVQAIAGEAAQSTAALRFLPLLSRRANWVVVMADPGARIVGYLPVNGFL